MKRPLLLIILDGWGSRAELEHNAVLACAPFFHELLGRYPNALLTACGEDVGLPGGIMGNSEVGHMNLGAGRVVHQDITRINASIRSGQFQENAAFGSLLERLRKSGKRLHLMGLLSDGGVHSSIAHLHELLKLAAAAGLKRDQVLVHAITDGRDTPPSSGRQFIEQLQRDIADAGVGRIATLIGRYWLMDRDNRWERVERAWRMLMLGEGQRRESALEAMSLSYAAEVYDEFLEPTILGEAQDACLAEGDGMISFNFRSDRMRQICRALAFEDFDDFERPSALRADIVTMTRYRADFPFPIAYGPQTLKDNLPEIISAAGLRQKRIAETEKYAHVTFFFSGGKEDELPGEQRILLPSPKVATYDLQPEMSAPGVTDAILGALEKDETDVYIINYANADMVGHTGIYSAACEAVAAVDRCLARVVPKVIELGGSAIITADHGNAEMLWDGRHDQKHTAHTLNPVPIVFCANELIGAKVRPQGILADVSPTLLDILELEKPAVMDARSLLE